MKCVIYLRTSTEEQEPENQKRDCLEFAKNKGYEVKEVLLEQLSGFKDIERPKYEKVKLMARNGEIKSVIVWALDRWVRNRDTLLDDVTILRNYGCKIHSVKEAWLEAINIDGALGKTIQDFLLGLIGSIAELESQRKSDRVKIAFQNHKGKRWGRPKTHTNKINVILQHLNDGLTYRQIKERTGMSIGKVSQIANVHKSEDGIYRLKPYESEQQVNDQLMNK
jgi:DNA invertase Pin-like site-specific DNA recombinase